MRPAWLVVLVVAIAAPVRAAGVLPSRMGMYTPKGTPLALVDSKIVVRMRGPIAEAIVTQTFRNETDRVTEATYIFPLPIDAAVTAMEIETGSRTIRAAIEPRDRAQQRYETAVAAGVGAALLDQERPDVFTQTVSAIPAKSTVNVTLRFDTVAGYHGGRWQLVLPMVVAPRYVPGSASGRPTTGTGRAPDTDRAPDASRVTPGGAPGAGGKTVVVLELGDAVDDVTSPTHDIRKEKAGYTFVDAKSDHDAVIRWRAKVPAAGWVEASDDGGYAAVVVEAPPAKPRKSELRVMLVLDRGATTRGDADALKRPFVRALLAGLGGKDQVAVTGSDTIDWRAPDQVMSALDGRWHQPGGAFDLTKTLARARPAGAPVVLVSDGLVADDRAALAAAGKLGVPIHVIGIGPAPNRGLLARIAAATGGTARFLAVDDDIDALATDVLADAAQPPEPLAITWGTLAATEVVPATLPRLGAGQAALVLAKVRRVQAANARVRGDVFGFVAVTPPRAPDGATTTRGSLARRWAKLKLDELVAAGNAKAITEHALRFGLVSPFTSMVAVGDEVVVKGGVKHSVPVTVSVPEGMRWQLVKRELSFDSTLKKNEEQNKQQAVKVGAKDAKKRPDTKRPGSTDRPKTVKRPPTTAKPRDVQPVPQAEPPAAGAPMPPAEPVAPTGAIAGELSEDEADDRESTRVEGSAADDDAPVAPSPRVGVATVDAAGTDEGEYLALESTSPQRRTRLSLALGAGLSVVGGDAAPLAALTGRFDVGRRALVGVEASLWLVDGLNAQGSALATVSYRGILRRLELGAGTGVRLTGDAIGPAWNVTLRARLPVRGVSTYLRYDGALLLHDDTFDGQNAGSLGLEATF